MRSLFQRKQLILLRELIKTDFKLRYQGSVLGYLWALIKPLMMFAILYVVFVHFLRFGADIPNYAIYLLLGVVLWSFFTEATSQGIKSIVERGDLLRKINFPKYIVVLAATSTALINLVINLGVVFLFALINGVDFRWTALLLPVIIIQIYFFSLGISFLLSAINVKYRDIVSIWEVVVQAMFYLVPIIYPIAMLAEFSPVVAKIALLNPMAQAIQDARFALVYDQTETVWNSFGNPLLSFIPIAIVLVLLFVSIRFFAKRARKFAEEY